MRDVLCWSRMRTTLTIDDDVMAAARALAAHEVKSVGEVISQLARASLVPARSRARTRNGVPLLEVRSSTPVTSELVRQLGEDWP